MPPGLCNHDHANSDNLSEPIKNVTCLERLRYRAESGATVHAKPFLQSVLSKTIREDAAFREHPFLGCLLLCFLDKTYITPFISYTSSRRQIWLKSQLREKLSEDLSAQGHHVMPFYVYRYKE